MKHTKSKHMRVSNNACRQFNVDMLIVAALTALGIGIFNALIDPYGIVNSPKMLGVNRLKPEQISRVRMFKAARVIHIQPRSLLMGTSRADLGLDPDHPALETVNPTYNLGLSGANMHEIRQYFEHALFNQADLEVVVIGLDFFMFNVFKEDEIDFSAARLKQRHPEPNDLLSVLFSLDAIESSVETLRYNFEPSPSNLYDAAGLRYQFGQRTKSSHERFQQMTTRLLETRGYYQQYELSQKYLQDLEAVIALAEQHDVQLYLFISPAHATLMESLYQAGLWSQYEAWKQSVVAIAPVWDFSGYNSVTTEIVSDEMINYVDSSHYSKEVGDLILNRVIGYRDDKVPNDFGQLLTVSTVDAYLENTLTDRQHWKQHLTNEMQLVYVSGS